MVDRFPFHIKVCNSTFHFTLLVPDTPGPGQYAMQSSFNAQSGKLGISLKGRIETKVLDASKPGPGEYSPRSMMGHEGKKFSLGARTPAVDMSKSKQNVPGPGAYTLKSSVGDSRSGFAIKGKLNEKIRNEGVVPIFALIVELVPGPGSYTVKSSIGDACKFSLSPRVQYSPSMNEQVLILQFCRKQHCTSTQQL